ncbi:MAG: hypothetical protein HC944_06480, partial [Nanoarchaeota archaeon]|nr:hypothetical protein [Nanoarchaeota archaeon]
MPLFTAGLAQSYDMSAFADKSKGTPTRSYGSANAGIVCGDRLCSEVPATKPVQEKQTNKMKNKHMMEKNL